MNIRPFTDDDAPVVAALISAEEERLYGRPGRLTGADILMFLQWSKEEWVWEEDGRIVASATYGVHGDAADIRGIVADKGRGLGAEIIDRGEAFARAEHAKKILLAAPEPDTAARALFESRGYREVRRFYSMAIELTEAPSEPVLPGGLVVDELHDGEYEAFYEALNESFAEHWEWHPKPFDEWLELGRGQHRDEHGPVWFVVRDGDELAAVTRNDAERRRRRIRRRDRRAARVAGQRARPRRCCRGRSPSSGVAARRASRSTWTPRTRPAPSRSTSASACTSTRAALPSRRRTSEPAARSVSGLPHAHRRRARRGLRVPQLRPHLQRRSRPRAARLGRRGRADGRGGVARARLSRGGGRRGGDARDADARGGLRPAGAAARPRRLLLLPRRRGRRAGGAPRPRRGPLARRARRPQHARDLPLRQRVGDAAAHAARPGDARRRRRRPLGSAEPRPARGGVHRCGRDRRRSRRACSPAPRRSTSRSTATCSIRTSSRSSCPSPAGRRSTRSSSCLHECGTAASSWASASRASRPTPRTSRSSGG